MSEATVFVVDDDHAVREGLGLLLGSAGFAVETYPSADDFLDTYEPGRPGCLVLDIRMPGLDGLALQERLVSRGLELPIIILSGHGDVPAAVRAFKHGAVDFFQKPVNEEALLAGVRQALGRDAERRRARAHRGEALHRLEKLTPREREVLEHVVAGRANKAIAAELGISERTVELHRARIMRKLKARSLPELTRLVLAAQA